MIIANSDDDLQNPGSAKRLSSLQITTEPSNVPVAPFTPPKTRETALPHVLMFRPKLRNPVEKPLTVQLSFGELYALKRPQAAGASPTRDVAAALAEGVQPPTKQRLTIDENSTPPADHETLEYDEAAKARRVACESCDQIAEILEGLHRVFVH